MANWAKDIWLYAVKTRRIVSQEPMNRIQLASKTLSKNIAIQNGNGHSPRTTDQIGLSRGFPLDDN
jgi:hypothetical protein